MAEAPAAPPAADCSKECQRQHWRTHRAECAQLKRWRLENRLPAERAEGAAPLSEAEQAAAAAGAAGAGAPAAEAPSAASTSAPAGEAKPGGQKKQKKATLKCGLCESAAAGPAHCWLAGGWPYALGARSILARGLRSSSSSAAAQPGASLADAGGNRRGPFERTPCCNRVVCSDEGDYQLLR